MIGAVSAAPELTEASVGKYKLIASLGHGGMADVYLASVSGPAGINKLQVIKRLRRESATDPERVAMFLDEARLAARVSHPNVVQTFEVGAAEGAYFIAMEWLEGMPFNRLISRARSSAPPRGTLLSVLADVLAGLHYAHELTDYDGTPLHVVHRDASPHNVIVTYDGHTKLLDFGIATSDARAAEPRSSAVTGKVQYMAPEQARAKEIDRRADIFVMGIVLWEIVAGRKLWDRGSDMEILHKLVTGAWPKIEDVQKKAPPPLVRILHRSLALEPEDRYATAAEMRAELLAYLDAEGLRVGPEEIGQYVSEQYADKRAEIHRVIERQLGKLSAMTSSGTYSADTPLPASVDPESLARLSYVPLGINGSGMLPRIPNERSLPPSTPPPPDVARTPLPPPLAKSEPPPPPQPQQQSPAAAPIPQAAPEPVKGEAEGPWLRYVAMGVGLVFLAALVALVAFRLLKGHKGATRETSPAAIETAAQQSDAKKTTIRLSVRATPKEAKIFLDGTPLETNPFTAEVPKDEIGHRLRAEAPNHSPKAQIVMFDQDQTIEIVLSPK